jgi:hypothetical protein
MDGIAIALLAADRFRFLARFSRMRTMSADLTACLTLGTAPVVYGGAHCRHQLDGYPPWTTTGQQAVFPVSQVVSVNTTAALRSALLANICTIALPILANVERSRAGT